MFGAGGESLFYVRNDPVTVRASQVWRHTIGSDTTTDVRIYEEKDPAFSVGLFLSKSRKFVLLHIEAEHTSEVRYLPVDQSNGELKIIEPRQGGVIYEIDHAGDHFFVRTNVNAPDFRMIIAPEVNPEPANWKEIIPEKKGHYLSHFEAFETFVAVEVEDEFGTKVRAFNFIDGAASNWYRRRIDFIRSRQ